METMIEGEILGRESYGNTFLHLLTETSSSPQAVGIHAVDALNGCSGSTSHSTKDK